MNEFTLNLFDPQFKANPYPTYAEARCAGGLLRNPMMLGQVMAVGHAEVSAVLSDAESFGMGGGAMGGQNRGLLAAATMLSSDPPDHERLRGVVSRAFTPRSVASFESRSREIAAHLVQPLADGESYDVVPALAERLPVLIIAEMLGVDTADLGSFIAWSHGLMGALDPLAPPETMAHAVECSTHLHDYFAGEVRKRRQRGDASSDLVGRIVEANAGGRMSEDEVLAACVLLLLGGNETTTKLITNAVLALSRFPDERRRLVDEPSLIQDAVEEFVRFDAPVQGDPRVAKRDIEVCGVTVPAATAVVCLLGSANHDEKVFEEPERLDVVRDPNPHLGFGRGIHYCLGANLSRIETRAAIEALLRVAPDFDRTRPDEPLRYEGTFFFHGPAQLEITRAV